MESYAQRSARLAAEVKTAREPVLGLGKDTSNLFRDRQARAKRRLQVGAFDHVLGVDAGAGWVDAEGMVPYDALVDAALAQGVMPAVVPQLKSITLGGAAAGVGIEATSFRFGLVHDTLVEIEVLTGTGDLVRATAENEYADLFHAFPNSYGTLGYALRLKARAVPVRRYVQVTHHRFGSARALFAALPALAASGIDFLDGVVFAADELYLSAGRFVDEAPWVSDYTFERIYYRSIRMRETDYLSAAGYLWRWDTDWFWCSRNLGAQNPLLRRLLGRRRLNSRFYTRVMRWNSRIGLTRCADRLSGRHRESVIQDVDLPLEAAADFLAFFLREIGILPVWICPFRTPAAHARCTLYPVEPDRWYVNFGFWDMVRRREPQPPGHFNRMLEAEVMRLGGIKSLYSDSYFAEDAFWRAYGGDAYRALKKRYDPDSRLGDLYAKCVLGH
jgi:FAD/FMN-containing dehydrogenase